MKKIIVTIEIRISTVIIFFTPKKGYTSETSVLIDNFDTHKCSLCKIQGISINLLVVYRESVNLIGYITRRLSADSLQF